MNHSAKPPKPSRRNRAKLPAILRRFVLAITLTLAVLAMSHTRSDAIARHFPLNDLTETAHRIVHAKVTGQSAAYNADNTQIWTTWTLNVTETLKTLPQPGTDLANGVIVAHTRGGTVGAITAVTSGEPTLAIDGEYVLFLWKDDGGYWNIVGQSQGALMVIREEDKAPRARNNYRGHRVTYVDGQQVLEKVGPIDQELTTLTAAIKAQVSVNGGAPAESAGPVETPAPTAPAPTAPSPAPSDDTPAKPTPTIPAPAPTAPASGTIIGRAE